MCFSSLKLICDYIKRVCCCNSNATIRPQIDDDEMALCALYTSKEMTKKVLCSAQITEIMADKLKKYEIIPICSTPPFNVYPYEKRVKYPFVVSVMLSPTDIQGIQYIICNVCGGYDKTYLTKPINKKCLCSCEVDVWDEPAPTADLSGTWENDIN